MSELLPMERRVHMFVCKLLGLDDSDHEDDGEAQPVEDAIILFLNEARIASVQLYMDTCEEQGVDPSWQSLHEFQDGQRLRFQSQLVQSSSPDAAGGEG